MDLHGENAFPEGPVWMDPQKTLAKNNKARNVLDCIWRKIMQLDSVHVQKCTEEGVQRKRKTSGEVVRKDDALVLPRMRDFFFFFGLRWLPAAWGI